jgi:hypothetical protein
MHVVKLNINDSMPNIVKTYEFNLKQYLASSPSVKNIPEQRNNQERNNLQRDNIRELPYKPLLNS